ncbi:hypothetical protein SDC9_109058 [bioreactor metagenome]|uniref:DUF1275 domain-containing protein n=1 Tax=bioreactor metagenome TaxID=1076179 RepID=A0A645B9T5_9ZZZZ
MSSKKMQMSESLALGILLALSGGFMDAYSYMARGHVFANAQTGNILLFGVTIASGQWFECIKYLFPIMAFIIGLALSNIFRHLVRTSRLHWRQFIVLTEAIIIAFTALVPTNMNLLANSLISFSCGLQVEAFQKIRGNNMATTMCIGNLKSATHFITDYCFSKNSTQLVRGLFYLLIILTFTIGAVLGSFFIKLWHLKAILISSLILLICFILMFKNQKVVK